MPNGMAIHSAQYVVTTHVLAKRNQKSHALYVDTTHVFATILFVLNVENGHAYAHQSHALYAGTYHAHAREENTDLPLKSDYRKNVKWHLSRDGRKNFNMVKTLSL